MGVWVREIWARCEGDSIAVRVILTMIPCLKASRNTTLSGPTIGRDVRLGIRVAFGKARSTRRSLLRAGDRLVGPGLGDLRARGASVRIASFVIRLLSLLLKASGPPRADVAIVRGICATASIGKI